MNRSIRTTGRRASAAVLGALAVFIAAVVIAPAAPAFAAVNTEPVTIAVGRSGDQRVLQVGGDGKSNSSPIVMAPYAAVTSTTAPRQRWNLERVTGTGIPTFTYRIKNPATGKCLNASGATAANKAPVILYTCNGTVAGKNELWWMDDNPSPDGTSFRSVRDNRCLDITGASTANNAATEVYTCVGGSWNQLFRTRTAGFDCTVRDSDWQVTAILCVSAGQATGVIANWFNTPASIAYRDPSTYVLSNEVRTRIMADVFDNLGTSSGDVQLGWRGLRAPTASGGVMYNAFWQEFGKNVEEYHAIPLLDTAGNQNGSGLADGSQHTYMMLGSDTTNQWDLFYDFNYVATTARQSGGRADFVTTGVQSRYIDALTQATPFEFRTQLMGLTGVWAQPDVTASALGNDKECGSFPVWEDFTDGAGNNQPPWCLTTARTLTNSTAVDTLRVSKPISPVSIAGTPTTAPRPSAANAARGSVNGVDQQALDTCMATGTSACLQTVPGLQRCVQLHLLCHTSTAPASRPTHNSRTHPEPVKAADAVTAARTTIHTIGPNRPAQAAKTTLAAAKLAITGYPSQTPVYVVKGQQQARSWNTGSKATYDGWTAVVDAGTGEVLYARLDHRH